MQASCLYPLAPASLFRLQEGKQVTVTPLYPATATLEPTSGNGHVPTPERKAETETTKAVTTTGQKKAATSSRRVARKNTKIAK